MTTIVGFATSGLSLDCMEPDCDFQSALINIEDWSPEDIDLVISLNKPETVLTADQEAQTKDMLSDGHTCPKHGRANLAFCETTVLITAGFISQDDL